MLQLPPTFSPDRGHLLERFLRSLPADFRYARFIGHPDAAVNRPWLERWSADLSRWIAEGREPYFFAHCPDNAPMPRFAREFHTLLGRSADVGEMPSWPGEGGQLSLL